MAAVFFQEDEMLGKAYDARIVRRLWKYIKPYWRRLLLALLFLLSTSVTDLLGPVIVANAIDSFITPTGAGASFSVQAREIGVFHSAALYIGILSLGFTLRYLQGYTTSVMGQLIMFDMRSEIFSHLQTLSLAFFDRNPVGRLMTRITNDVDSLNQLFTSGAVELLGDVTTLVGIMVVMLIYNLKLALITFIVIPPLLYVVSRFQGAMRDSFRAQRIRLARINATIAEVISGIQVLQLFNREKQSFDVFRNINNDFRVVSRKSLFYIALFFPVITIFSSAATALVIWVGGGDALRGVISFGAWVLFFQYIDRFFLPIRDLADKYTTLQTAMASSERIFRILDEQPAVQDSSEPQHLMEPVRGEITFKNVWFAYNEGEWILKDVSFTIPAGKSVAFVGATGAGKTSLISLISRFYDIQKGEILIDGVNIKHIPQRELRQHVGAVLQDPFIFAGDIAFNIRLHEARITNEQIYQAAAYVNAAPFIEQLPGGYSHIVNERGAGLSVGQKQLIAFARAIAFNPEMLLVMDEATSNVDTETEYLIQDALEKLMKGRTSIIIAHRLSTIRNVDHIIVLHKGQIVEQGAHEQLLNKRGVYYRLYELQYNH